MTTDYREATTVYRVTAPVEEIHALPGDFLVVRPTHPTAKVTLVRTLLDVALQVLDDRFVLSDIDDVAASRNRAPLRLVTTPEGGTNGA